MSVPNNYADGSGLKFLSILRRGIHSLHSLRKNVLEELLKHLDKKKNSRYNKDSKSQVYRIMLLLCKFIKYIESDSPHRDFIISCILFLKSNQEATFRELSIYLDLLNMDSSRVCDFYSIFSDFCNFAGAEMTERSFLCFFDLMRDVLSHELFMKRFSNLLIKISNNLHLDISIDESVNEFAVRTSNTLRTYLFLIRVNPFRVESCSKCSILLDDINYIPSLRRCSKDEDGDGDDLCDECFDTRGSRGW